MSAAAGSAPGWRPAAVLAALAPRSLATCLAERRDNFHLLRLFAAALVLFGHCWAIGFNPAHDTDPLGERIGLFSGTVAVDVFFWVSGFLVTMSYSRRQSPFDFVASRALRIFPGLAVCILASALLLGPLVTTLPMSAYFRSREVWDYIGCNIRLGELRWDLPGVFESNYRREINGSLWTLPGEIRMYTFVLGLGLLGFLRDRLSFWCGLAALGCAILAFPTGQWLQQAEYREFAAFFAAGAFCWFHREHVPVSALLLAALLILAWLCRDTAAYPVLLRVTIGYAALWLAYGPRLPFPEGAGDYSYGLYLYAYPVQQLVASWFPTWTPWPLFALALPLATVCAVLSWHRVEKPALRWKPRARG